MRLIQQIKNRLVEHRQITEAYERRASYESTMAFLCESLVIKLHAVDPDQKCHGMDEMEEGARDLLRTLNGEEGHDNTIARWMRMETSDG